MRQKYSFFALFVASCLSGCSSASDSKSIDKLTNSYNSMPSLIKIAERARKPVASEALCLAALKGSLYTETYDDGIVGKFDIFTRLGLLDNYSIALPRLAPLPRFATNEEIARRGSISEPFLSEVDKLDEAFLKAVKDHEISDDQLASITKKGGCGSKLQAWKKHVGLE